MLKIKQILIVIILILIVLSTVIVLLRDNDVYTITESDFNFMYKFRKSESLMGVEYNILFLDAESLNPISGATLIVNIGLATNKDSTHALYNLFTKENITIKYKSNEKGIVCLKVKLKACGWHTSDAYAEGYKECVATPNGYNQPKGIDRTIFLKKY